MPIVFLSHKSDDKPYVEAIANRLQEKGIDVWLDKWNLVPGEPWQEAIEDALQSCGSCVVFVGPSGLGPWQNEEMRAAVERRVAEPGVFRVVPVLLPGAKKTDLPKSLVRATWVEFGNPDDDDAFQRLVCAETAPTLLYGAATWKTYYQNQKKYVRSFISLQWNMTR